LIAHTNKNKNKNLKKKKKELRGFSQLWETSNKQDAILETISQHIKKSQPNVQTSKPKLYRQKQKLPLQIPQVENIKELNSDNKSSTVLLKVSAPKLTGLPGGGSEYSPRLEASAQIQTLIDTIPQLMFSSVQTLVDYANIHNIDNTATKCDNTMTGDKDQECNESDNDGTFENKHDIDNNNSSDVNVMENCEFQGDVGNALITISTLMVSTLEAILDTLSSRFPKEDKQLSQQILQEISGVFSFVDTINHSSPTHACPTSSSDNTSCDPNKMETNKCTDDDNKKQTTLTNSNDSSNPTDTINNNDNELLHNEKKDHNDGTPNTDTNNEDHSSSDDEHSEYSNTKNTSGEKFKEYQEYLEKDSKYNQDYDIMAQVISDLCSSPSNTATQTFKFFNETNIKLLQNYLIEQHKLQLRKLNLSVNYLLALLPCFLQNPQGSVEERHYFVLFSSMTIKTICETFKEIYFSSKNFGTLQKIYQTLLKEKNPHHIEVDLFVDESGSTDIMPFSEENWESEKEVFSLNSLIKMLTSPENYDASFMRTFIVTYRSILTPLELLSQLIRRYEEPGENLAKVVRLRVTVVLKYWIENQFQDFDDDLIDKLFSFANTLDPSLSSLLLTELENKVKMRATMTHSPSLDNSLRISRNRLIFSFEHFMQIPTEEIAQTTTMIDFETFRKIQPLELLSQAWSSEKLKYRSLHVRDMISKLNKFSFWVATISILPDKKKLRAAVISKFIKLADNLYKLRNFNGVMGVLAGINISAVSRLKHTFSLVSRKNTQLLKQLENIMSPQKSYSCLRDTISTSKTPLLPFLGVYLTDLTFIEEGNPDTIAGKINFRKRFLVNRVIQNILVYQQTPYNFEINSELQRELMTLPSFNEKYLFLISRNREPRDSTFSSIP